MSFARVARSALQQACRHRASASLRAGNLPELLVVACNERRLSTAGCCHNVLPDGCLSARSFASSSSGNNDDTHEDFRPQMRADATPSAADQINQDIADNKVFIYMKGVPSAPQCGFSNMACRILDAYGVDYSSRNVLEDPDVREAVKQHTDWPTIPQVFVDGEFVGGSDILLNMHQSGELFKMLDSSGAKPVQPFG